MHAEWRSQVVPAKAPILRARGEGRGVEWPRMVPWVVRKL